MKALLLRDRDVCVLNVSARHSEEIHFVEDMAYAT